MDVYLDIETTGLSSRLHKVTIIGLCFGESGQVVQLVGQDISVERLRKALGATPTIYTYNGSRFDLPFLKTQLGIDLAASFAHHDLMLDCWRCGIFGGLKTVEKTLGIPRLSAGIDGRDAVRLWKRYEKLGDSESLRLLLDYNREDIQNLRMLRRLLA